MPTDADVIAGLPYRPCVGLMIMNRDGHLFAGQRIDNPSDAWQMPQGGIDPGETPEIAALRELHEETSIEQGNIIVLRESAIWRRYDLPRTLVPKLWGGKYRGQEQRWFALQYLGDNSDIRIDTAEPEFRRWTWMAHDELINKIIPFKRDTYTEVFHEFADLIDGTQLSA